MTETHTCAKCKRLLPISKFYINRRRANARTSKCEECRVNKEWFETEIYYIGTLCKRNHAWSETEGSLRWIRDSTCIFCVRERSKTHWKTRNREPAKRMVKDAKNRAEKKGLEFNISSEIIYELNEKQNGKCIYTGIDLNWDYSEKCPRYGNRVSLDRIDNSKGYTAENIQLITDLANRAKNVQTHEGFIAFCRTIADRFPVSD